MMPLKLLKLKLKKTPPLLLLLPVLLTGCAATLPTCEPVSQPLPAPPSISMPLPQASYSLTVAESLQTWRQKLMDTLPMSD